MKRILMTAGSAYVALAYPAMAQTAAQTGADDSQTATAPAEPSPSTDSLPAATSGDDTARHDNDIIVTGTRIVRQNLSSTSPITTIDEQYLKDRGLGQITDALSVLPQVTPMLGLKGSSEFSGPAQIALRNLGIGRTLTLLNGQRMENDVNIIPGALIDRVDIMTGGASAVYGSDAIAGVVNFITKRRFTGLTLDGEISVDNHVNDNRKMLAILANAGYPKPNKWFFGGDQIYLSAAAGHDFFGGRLNLSVFAGYRQTSPITYRDLDTTGCQLYMDPQRNLPDNYVATHDKWDCGYTEYNPYGYFGTDDDDFTNAKDGSRTWRKYDSHDNVSVPQDDYIQRQDRTINGGAFVSFDVTKDIKLNGNFLYTQYKTGGEKTVPDYFYAWGVYVPCDNPFLGAQQAQLLCGANAGVPGETGRLYTTLYRNAFNQNFRNRTSDWRGSINLSGTLTGKIRFDVSYQRSRHSETYTTNNAYYGDTADRFARGLQVVNVNGVPTCQSVIDGTHPECVPFDIFSASSTPSDAAFATLANSGISRWYATQQVVSGVVSGTLEDYGIKSPFAVNGIGFAVVAEGRRNIVSAGGEGAYDYFTRYTGRDGVKELGAEIDIPLIEKRPFFYSLNVNGGYRLSDYNSYRHLIRTWKAEMTYEPVQGLGIRASFNRAVRVGVEERLEAQRRYPDTYFLDLCAPPRKGSKLQRYTFQQCAIGGMTREQYDALTNYKGCDEYGYCPAVSLVGGNPDLNPERSRSTTIGLLLKPRGLKGFSGTIDYYYINVEGAFEYARTGMAFDQCYKYGTPVFCAMYIRDPKTGVLQEVNGIATNSGFRSTRGIDINANYHLDLPGAKIGSFDFAFNGNYVISSRRQIAPNNPTYDCIGYFGFVCRNVQPRWRHYADVTWISPGKLAIDVAWRHTAGTRNSKLSSDPLLAPSPTQFDTDTYPLAMRLPAANYFDLSINLPINKQMSLRFNVQNVMDKDPPMVGFPIYDAYFNTFPSYYDALGRTLRLGFTAKL